MEKVVLHVVPRKEALAAVSGANIAAVIASVEKEGSSADHGMIPAKVYVELRLETPVLLVCPAGF